MVSEPAGSASGEPAEQPDPPPATQRSRSDVGPIYLATLSKPVTVISLRSAGRLELSGGCVTALIRGARYTAVFPPGARLNGTTSVSYGGRSLPIGRDTTLPGGGGDITAAALVAPPPATCPRDYFIIGG